MTIIISGFLRCCQDLQRNLFDDARHIVGDFKIYVAFPLMHTVSQAREIADVETHASHKVKEAGLKIQLDLKARLSIKPCSA